MKAFIMKTASVALQLLAFVSIHAQNRLTESTNQMRDSDSITMQGMEYSWAGDAGEKVIWDFSGVEAQNDRHPIIIGKDTAGNLQRIEDRKVCTFTEKSDMLKILKMENRLEHVNYDTPMLSMRYPFQYGDSISSLFFGHKCQS